MNNIVVIDGERFDKIMDSIDFIKEAALNPLSSERPLNLKPSHLNWMPLSEFCDELGINQRHFDRYFKKKLKHKKYAHKTYIHKPSLEKWFMETAIN